MAFYKEHLKVTGVQPRQMGDFAAIRTVQIVQVQLSVLCGAMIAGCGRIDRLLLTVDGERLVFSGHLPTTELAAAIAGMTDAEEVEMETEFSTAWDYADSDAITEELDDMALGEEVPWERICFEMRVTDEKGCEGIYRYGVFNGRISCGRQD